MLVSHGVDGIAEGVRDAALRGRLEAGPGVVDDGDARYGGVVLQRRSQRPIAQLRDLSGLEHI